MNEPSFPIVRLMPKADARAIRHGFPWVYANDLVLDRRTKALAPGSIAILQDAQRENLALVAVNPSSKIAVRVLDKAVDVNVDQRWFEERLRFALAHRERLYPAPFYRLIHAEADGLPGVIIDRFGETAVIQPNAAWADARLSELAQALVAVTRVSTVIANGTSRARGLEGLEERTDVLIGSAPAAAIEVPMNGATYMADLIGGQKTGLFYDQRSNHAFAAGLAKDGEVLDVFSHVGGFALAALANGAESALAVDGSAAALELAQAGAEATGVGARFSTEKSDAFAALTKFGEDGRQFDVVICDPPAFAPSKSALQTGLRAYERVARLAAPMVREGGYLILCSCSHAAELSKFRASCIRGIGRAGRAAQIVHTGQAGPDHPLMPQLAESGYLKAVFFRL